MKNFIYLVFLLSLTSLYGMTNEEFLNKAITLLPPEKRTLLIEKLGQNAIFFYIENESHLEFIARQLIRQKNPNYQRRPQSINNSCLWTLDGQDVRVQIKSDIITMPIDEVKSYLLIQVSDEEFFNRAMSYLDAQEYDSLKKQLSKKNIHVPNKDFKKLQQLTNSAHMIAFDSEWDFTPQQQANALKENTKEIAALRAPICIHNKADKSKLYIEFKDQIRTIDIALARSYLTNK